MFSFFFCPCILWNALLWLNICSSFSPFIYLLFKTFDISCQNYSFRKVVLICTFKKGLFFITESCIFLLQALKFLKTRRGRLHWLWEKSLNKKVKLPLTTATPPAPLTLFARLGSHKLCDCISPGLFPGWSSLGMMGSVWVSRFPW